MMVMHPRQGAIAMWRQSTAVDRDERDKTLVANADGAPTTLDPGEPVADEARKNLRTAFAAFRASFGSGVLSAKRMIDPLLELWSLASAVDAAVARPIEALLVTLVERSVVTGAELLDCVDRAEEVLARLPTWSTV